MVNQIVELIGQEYTKDEEDIPEFGPGDTVRVSVKVVEGGRERIQVFKGIVIRRRKAGVNENFTVRRVASHGVGVERTFMLHSPRIDKIEVARYGVVHRAALYYLRGRTGKAARIKERKLPNRVAAAKAAAAQAALTSSTAQSSASEPAAATATPIVATTQATSDVESSQS